MTAETTHVDPTDPYAPLSAHIGTVRALYCEDGCGEVQTAAFSLDDKDAADELAERGWAVRPHSLGGLTALCKACVEQHDREVREDNEVPTPPGHRPCAGCDSIGESCRAVGCPAVTLSPGAAR